MKHTPGPWTVAIYRDDPDSPPSIEQIKEMVCACVDRTVEKGTNIPDFYFVMSSMDKNDPIHTAIVGNGPTSEANAYLISAAPELLEACKMLIGFIPDGWEMPLGWNQVVAQAHAAIAKAEGGL